MAAARTTVEEVGRSVCNRDQAVTRDDLRRVQIAAALRQDRLRFRQSALLSLKSWQQTGAQRERAMLISEGGGSPSASRSTVDVLKTLQSKW